MVKGLSLQEKSWCYTVQQQQQQLLLLLLHSFVHTNIARPLDVIAAG